MQVHLLNPSCRHLWPQVGVNFSRTTQQLSAYRGHKMLLQPPVSSGFGLNQVCNFIFNISPLIYLPGTSSVNACRLLGSKALCSKTKVFTTQLYFVWRITSVRKAVLVNYVVRGWECFFVYTEKWNSPLSLSWFLEDYHFLPLDGSMTALPLSLPVSMHRKNEVGRLIQTLDAWISTWIILLEILIYLCSQKT